jgi:segregation and condensation protein A
MHKSSLVGMFLAILELVRHHGARAEQSDLFGEIWILPIAENPAAPSEDPADDGAEG